MNHGVFYNQALHLTESAVDALRASMRSLPTAAFMGDGWSNQQFAEFQKTARLPAFEYDDDPEWEDRNILYRGREESVAVIPIRGIIMKRPRWFARNATTLIANQISRAVDAGKRIVLDVDTPGGSASAWPELSDLIYRARSETTIVCVANDLCGSAGYAFASAADRVVVTQAGSVGSIGTLAVYREFTKRNEEEGITDVVLKHGEHKVAGHPSVAMSDADRQYLTDRLAELQTIFVEHIARNRDVSVARVREDWADGRLVIGQTAVDLGLADSVGTLDDVVSELAESASRNVVYSFGENTMQLTLTEAGQLTIPANKANDPPVVVGSISQLGLSAEQLRQFCGGSVAQIVQETTKKVSEETTKTVAEQARAAVVVELDNMLQAFPDNPAQAVADWKAGKSPTEAKAAAFDAAQQRIAELEKQAALPQGPPSGGTNQPPARQQHHAATTPEMSDAEFQAAVQADWDKDVENCKAEFQGIFSTYLGYRKAVRANMTPTGR